MEASHAIADTAVQHKSRPMTGASVVIGGLGRRRLIILSQIIDIYASFD